MVVRSRLDVAMRMHTGSACPKGDDLTALLQAWSDGEPHAAERVVPLVYRELRVIAAGLFRSRAPDTLQPTAVAHEACIRLIERKGVRWQSRAHFFGSTARVMRQVLVDHARRKACRKRGGGASTVALRDELVPARERAPDLVELDHALVELEALAPEQAAVVELRYFGGLTVDQVARHTGVSSATVGRRWRRARAWLYDRLRTPR